MYYTSKQKRGNWLTRLTLHGQSRNPIYPKTPFGFTYVKGASN